MLASALMSRCHFCYWSTLNKLTIVSKQTIFMIPLKCELHLLVKNVICG